MMAVAHPHLHSANIAPRPGTTTNTKRRPRARAVRVAAEAATARRNGEAEEDVAQAPTTQRSVRSVLNTGAYDLEVAVAAQAVRAASRLCQTVQERMQQRAKGFEELDKDDGSEVTVADYSAQAVVSYILQRAFPATPISLVGEEDSTDLASDATTLGNVVKTVNDALMSTSAQVGPLRNLLETDANGGFVPLTPEQVMQAIDAGAASTTKSGKHWVLDPVDGTYGFVKGDQYAVALALVDDGELVVGALGCPNLPTRPEFLAYAHRYHRLLTKLFPSPEGASPAWDKGCLFLAQRGRGCTVEPVGNDAVVALNLPPRPVRMKTRDAKDATFCEPVRKGVSNQGRNSDIASHLGVENKPLRLYSMVKYACVARGDADIFMKFPKAGYKEKVWDHAAGVIVVEEAGGVVSDASGKPLDFSEGRFLESCDRGIVAASSSLHGKLVDAVEASYGSAML